MTNRANQLKKERKEENQMVNGIDDKTAKQLKPQKMTVILHLMFLFN